MDRQGFIERTGGLIAECKQCNVKPEDLSVFASSLPEGAGRDKMNDLALIYASYEQSLSEQFVDGEDVLSDMLERLPESGIAKDAVIALFGFDILTSQLSRLLLALSAQGKETEALIVLGPEDVFAPVLDSVHRLQREAEETEIPCSFSFLLI